MCEEKRNQIEILFEFGGSEKGLWNTVLGFIERMQGLTIRKQKLWAFYPEGAFGCMVDAWNASCVVRPLRVQVRAAGGGVLTDPNIKLYHIQNCRP